MNSTTSQKRLITGMIISFIIHLIILAAYKPGSMHPKVQQQPIYVEVIPDKPQRETLIPKEKQPQKVDSNRLAAANQRVIKEQAVPGRDYEDSSPQSTASAAATPQPKKQQQKKTAVKQPKLKVDKQPSMQVVTPKPQPLPDIDTLMQSATSAAADIARESRIKKRPMIESGDELILNMKQDKLFSFFARFKKGIYMVWNYPEESIRKGQRGITTLKIVINRDGSVADVDLLSGSGFERLDREAIAAIFKGAPYGRLPDSFPDQQLILNPVNFEYIYGSRIPHIYRQ